MSVKEVTPEAPAAAAPVSATGKKTNPVKPDQAAYEKELKEIDANIAVLKKKLADAQSKISGSDNIKDSFGDKRKELRAQLDELIKERNETGDKRTKLIDQLKAIQSSLRKKSDDTKSSKDRLGYKSVEEVEAKIVVLERQQQSGEASLHEEKRIVAEISNLKKAKKILEGFAGQQSSVEDEKKNLDAIRAQVDALNPQRDEIRVKIDAIKEQIAQVDSERKDKQGSLNDLWTDRKAVKAELDAEYEKLRAHKTEHKKLNDEWYNWQREEQTRKREQYQARLREDKEARLAVQAEKEREAAEIPAYTDEINQCTTLIRFLESFDGSSKSSSSLDVKPAASATPAFTPRKVEGLPEGAVLVKKEEEDFMVLGNKKSKKGKRQGSAASGANGGASPAAKPFKLDFEMIDQFVKLKFELPTSAADIPGAIAKIQEKKKWYQDHQEEATNKAKAAAEAKVAALRRGEDPNAVTAATATTETEAVTPDATKEAVTAAPEK
ncbi:hypothetical protein DFJ77DRAFT_460019 [Powellomyces hirtus]|nr:hypothetical protein DFJ77DRAFT_460019 [Powellomyces hirtus]